MSVVALTSGSVAKAVCTSVTRLGVAGSHDWLRWHVEPTHFQSGSPPGVVLVL
jgi:hypothetical protein